MKTMRRLNAIIVNFSKNIYRHIAGSMLYKLMILMLSVIILPLMLLIIFSINLSQNNYEKEVVNSNDSRIILAGKYLDQKLIESDKILFASLIDEKLIPSISQTNDKDIPLNLSTLDYIHDKLSSISYGMENFDGISIYAKESQTVYSLQDNDFKVSKIANTNGTKWGELGNKPQYTFDSRHPKQTFSLTRSIIKFENRKIIGGISLDINWNVFDSVIKMLKSEQGSSVFILNSQGGIIYNPNLNKKTSINCPLSGKI